MLRIALANLRRGRSPGDALALTLAAIAEAGAAGAAVVCFPEAYVPGYRCLGGNVPPPDGGFLERAWNELAGAAAGARVAVVLGTERATSPLPTIAAAVFGPDGRRVGFQDKVQLDPGEEGVYQPGAERRVFRAGELTFGVAICHEAFRYPETVRWAVRRGAQVVFSPHLSEYEPGERRGGGFADPGGSFHEGSMRCRAAENTCYFASVNCASTDSPTTSAVIDPEGGVVAAQPRGREGLLLADLDLARATGLLARRYRPLD